MEMFHYGFIMAMSYHLELTVFLSKTQTSQRQGLRLFLFESLEHNKHSANCMLGEQKIFVVWMNGHMN